MPYMGFIDGRASIHKRQNRWKDWRGDKPQPIRSCAMRAVRQASDGEVFFAQFLVFEHFGGGAVKDDPTGV
ncbi:hypothetical protein SAMN05443635_102341 [Roseobacter denitrificans OCh 114]|nr:hypothetical protein SAMN05443635_102341 [Roseobacter denitrificans OCh 114]